MAAWITLDVLNILVSAPPVCKNGCLLYIPSPSPILKKKKKKKSITGLAVSFNAYQLSSKNKKQNYNLPHVPVVANGVVREFFLG